MAPPDVLEEQFDRGLLLSDDIRRNDVRVAVLSHPKRKQLIDVRLQMVRLNITVSDAVDRVAFMEVTESVHMKVARHERYRISLDGTP